MLVLSTKNVKILDCIQLLLHNLKLKQNLKNLKKISDKDSDEFDVNEFVTVSYSNFEKLQYILYTDDEYFDELVKIFNNYECILYQFIIVTDDEKVVYQ